MAQQENKQVGLSNNLLRWLYFFLTLVFAVLMIAIMVLQNSEGFTLLGITWNVNNVNPMIDRIKNISSLPGEEIFKTFVVLAVAVYQFAGTIVFLVLFIILLVQLFALLGSSKNRKKVEQRFRRAFRALVGVAVFFFMFDSFIQISGGTVGKSYIFEVALLGGMFFLNTCFYILRKNVVNGFDLGSFIYSIVEFIGVGIALYLIAFGLKEPFMATTIKQVIDMSTKGGQPTMEFFMSLGGATVRLVGFFLALSMIRRVVRFYPNNDKKGVGRSTPFAINGLFGKSIACIVIFVVAGVTLQIAKVYDTIPNALIKDGALLMVVVLAIAICLKISYKINYNEERAKRGLSKEEDSDEEDGDEDNEPAPAPKKEPAPQVEETPAEQPQEEQPAPVEEEAK